MVRKKCQVCGQPATVRVEANLNGRHSTMPEQPVAAMATEAPHGDAGKGRRKKNSSSGQS